MQTRPASMSDLRLQEIAYLMSNRAPDGARTYQSGFLAVNGYPGGEPMVSFATERSSQVERLLLRPRSIGSLMTGLFFVDALVERGLKVPELIFPCVLGARQDRINPAGDFLFTAKSVAKEINARNFPRVTVIDPHSDVTTALIDRCRPVHYGPAAKYAAVVAPDAGAEKRASRIAKIMGVPVIRAWKSRDVATGKITGFGMEPTNLAPGSTVVVIDDICDGGGTFIGLADCLDEAGLRADLFVSHGIFSQGAAALLARYESVICTDSLVGIPDGVTVIPVCSDLLQGK